MAHPRSAYGASPSRGRRQWPGKAGSTVALARAAIVLFIALGACNFASAQASATKHDEAPAALGVKSQNIFDVKPDASADPGYANQTNGQRNHVQPGNNAPMYRDIQRGAEGFTNYPKDKYPEAGVLIQAPVQYPGSAFVTAGEAWREVRNNWIVPYGGSLILIWAVALAIFYFTRGRIGHNDAVGGGGVVIERFTPFERAAHWTNAIAFCVLAISGMVMAFGRFFLLPLLGLQLYGPLTYLLKNLHNFFGPLFTVSLIIVLVTFIKDEFPRHGDLKWLVKFGNVFKKNAEEPPTHRFNAGEKVVYWVQVVVLGFFIVSSGLSLDKLLPIEYTRQVMQWSHMFHSTAAVLIILVTGFHIYLGTVGVRGAYTAMRHGYVDEAWAHEHHGYWLEDIQAGKIPAQRSQPSQPIGAGVPEEKSA
jgi:formate dehydrogenase subunit gamma